jgi:UDP-N-acetylglucosamine--N-acetylmuramyl-(pentapeptide) pyrophosphoryl-undecaprenol N-acetylglucosamine transferase
MANAHLVLARSGAGTVNELAVIGRPSILVPLPHALDNDQLRNAQALSTAGAAILAEQKELNPERLSALLSATLQDPHWMENCARAAKTFGRPNAAKLLADLVEDTARENKSKDIA